MKVLFKSNETQIELNDEAVNLLTVENPRAFEKMCTDAVNHYMRRCEGLSVLKDGLEYNIIPFFEVVTSPFDFEVSKKNTQKALIKSIASDNEYSKNAQYIEEALLTIKQGLLEISALSSYELEYKEVESLADLLKLVDVHISNLETDCFIERLVSFIAACNSLQGTTFFVVLNCGGMLDETGIIEIDKLCKYLGITILLIDPLLINVGEEYNRYIIDKDMCILH